MKIKMTYSDAVQALIERQAGDAAYSDAADARRAHHTGAAALTSTAAILVGLASDIDCYVEDIARKSRALAESFADYAQQVEVASYDVTPPTQSSRIADITYDSGRLAAARKTLFELVGALYGRNAAKQFRQDLA
jgi:hypothetical protein